MTCLAATKLNVLARNLTFLSVCGEESLTTPDCTSRRQCQMGNVRQSRYAQSLNSVGKGRSREIWAIYMKNTRGYNGRSGPCIGAWAGSGLWQWLLEGSISEGSSRERTTPGEVLLYLYRYVGLQFSYHNRCEDSAHPWVSEWAYLGNNTL